MKTGILIVTIFLLLSCNSNRDNKLTQGFSSLPAFDIMMLDSTTVFNTNQIPAGSPTILLYFSPDCEHCHAQITSLLKNMNSLQNVRLYLFSPASVSAVKDFYNSWHLDRYKNIVVGKEHIMSFYKTFKIPLFPVTVIYDKTGNLVKLYKGPAEINSIIEAVNS